MSKSLPHGSVEPASNYANMQGYINVGPPTIVNFKHLRPPKDGVNAVRPDRLHPLINRISTSVLELRWCEMKIFFHWLQTQIVLLINDWLVANPPGLRSTIQGTAGQSTIIQSKAVSKVVQIKAAQVKAVVRAVQCKAVRKAVQVKAMSQAVQSMAVSQAVQSMTVRQTVQSMAVGQAVLTTAGKSWRVGGRRKPQKVGTNNPRHSSQECERVQLVSNFLNNYYLHFHWVDDGW